MGSVTVASLASRLILYVSVALCTYGWPHQHTGTFSEMVLGWGMPFQLSEDSWLRPEKCTALWTEKGLAEHLPEISGFLNDIGSRSEVIASAEGELESPEYRWDAGSCVCFCRLKASYSLWLGPLFTVFTIHWATCAAFGLPWRPEHRAGNVAIELILFLYSKPESH